MLINYKILSNLFDDPNITPARFLDFNMYLHDQMTANNTNGKYDADLIRVKSVIDSVDKEINQVDIGFNTQLTNTSEVNEFIKGFGQFMKINNGTIAYALGGIETKAFRDFYPHKNEEYLSANRKAMPKLVARVSELATTYADQLGVKLTADLQAFSPNYKKVLSAQRQQIGTVKQTRTGRNTAFADGQWTLTAVVHSVAGINNRNPAESEILFDFTKLYPQSKQLIVKANGKLAAKESKEIVNRFLNVKTIVSVRNSSANADALVWLAMSPTGDAPEKPMLVKANSKEDIKAPELGDLKGTFLMIQNASDVNEVSYEIEITSLKKTKEEKEAEAKAEAEKMEVVRADKKAS